MKSASNESINALSMRAGGALALLLLISLLLAPRADASLEQVSTFSSGPVGPGSENYLDGGRGGSIAVNTTGAGGVPPGTVYAVNKDLSAAFRYSPKGEFREAWGWGVSEPPLDPEQFERCGPDGEPAHPVCKPPENLTAGHADSDPGRLHNPSGIAVNQATGYVYILQYGTNSPLDNGLLQVFTPSGSPVTNFLDRGEVDEAFDQSPEKLHINAADTSIAVDDSGTLYISDSTAAGGGDDRVMVWKPQSPGDYEHYVYSGRANDIDTYGHLALDGAGNLYSAENRTLREFAPGQTQAPICEYEDPTQNLIAMTVNLDTGEPYYWDYKSAKVIHALSACEGGQFEDRGTLTLAPNPGLSGTPALAFDPNQTWTPARPPGVLYFAVFSDSQPLGYIFAPAEARLPEVESEEVSAATTSTVTLNAQINPNGSATHYSFQYISKAAYEANAPGEEFLGATEAPLGGDDLPASQEALAAAATVVGLQVDTEYRYRVIASSHCNPANEEEACEDTGQAEAFRTFAAESAGLPDNRAWELVSPIQKNGGEVFPLEPNRNSGPECGGCKPGAHTQVFPAQASPDGEAVAYEGQPFSAAEGAPKENEYVSRRTPSGWRTTILAPALLNGTYRAFDSALTRGLLSQAPPTLTADAPSGFSNLYAQPTAAPSSLNPLLGAAPPNRAPGTLSLEYAGASDDLSHVFFAANDALSGETQFAPSAIDGGLEKRNLYEWAEGQLRLVNVLPGNVETLPGGPPAAAGGFGFGSGAIVSGDFPHAISADGSHAYWSDEAGQVYVRLNGKSTIEVPDPGHFLTASEDGSEVLLDDGHLYDLETEKLTDLTEGQGGFEGVAGQSDDLSHVYFVDTAVLGGEEENAQGAKAQAGKFNLYAWHEGTVSYVATLLPEDMGNSTFEGDAFPEPFHRTAEASPSGRWLAFLSEAPLTGYDNVAIGCYSTLSNTRAPVPCKEAFLYDAESGRLLCASCNPSGARPLGRTRLPVLLASSETYLSQPRYLLDSGRLYFDSQDALSPSDTNRARERDDIDGHPFNTEKVGAEDVYEFEPEGVGSCAREDGCVSLLSAGHDSDDSNFFAVDGSGKNVFFTTRDRLVPSDTDELMDLYVAREGGGIAAETEAARDACRGEACQTRVFPPGDFSPGSSSFNGDGNVVERTKGGKHKKHPHRHKKKKHRRARPAKHDRGGAR